MRHLVRLTSMTMLSVMATAPAHALSILLEDDLYKQTLVASGVGSASNTVGSVQTASSFSGELGTLLDIELEFRGLASFVIDSGRNAIPNPFGDIWTPYTITPRLSIRMSGLYDVSPINLTGAYLFTGLGEPAAYLAEYQFRFNWIETLNRFNRSEEDGEGTIFVTPPAALDAQLQDFLNPLPLVLTYELSFTEFPRITDSPTMITATNSLQVYTRYTYQPAPEPPDPQDPEDPTDPVPVPEPGTAGLLIAGIAACWLRRRSRLRQARLW